MKTVFIICTFFVGLRVYAGYYTSPKHVQRAIDYGAEAKVVFQVVDNEGSPVEDAQIGASFVMNTRDGNYFEGRTDSTGRSTGIMKTVGEIVYRIEKKGYYVTRGRIWIQDFNLGDKLVVDGKWQPWGIEEKVVLKPIKNPCPLLQYDFLKNDLPSMTPIGFDLMEGDFIEPFGKGITADFICEFDEEVVDMWHFKSKLSIRFPNKSDGGYIRQKDLYSDFITDYVAEINQVYLNKFDFVFDRLDPKNRIDTSVNKNQYIVLRTRTVLDTKGNIKEAMYSLIRGPWSFMRCGITMNIFVNPEINSNNLEWGSRAIKEKQEPSSL